MGIVYKTLKEGAGAGLDLIKPLLKTKKQQALQDARELGLLDDSMSADDALIMMEDMNNFNPGPSTIKTVDDMKAHLNSPGAEHGILGNTGVDRVYDDFAGSVNIKTPQNIKQTASPIAKPQRNIVNLANDNTTRSPEDYKLDKILDNIEDLQQRRELRGQDFGDGAFEWNAYGHRQAKNPTKGEIRNATESTTSQFGKLRNVKAPDEAMKARWANKQMNEAGDLLPPDLRKTHYVDEAGNIKKIPQEYVNAVDDSALYLSSYDNIPGLANDMRANPLGLIEEQPVSNTTKALDALFDNKYD